MTETFYAHSANAEGQKHLLATHLTNVAEAARNFAGDAPWADETVLAGHLHDLGKYADLFQARLRGEVSGLDHWSPGAWVALEHHAVAAALAIQGHHIGLQQGSKDALRAINPLTLAQWHPLNLKLSDVNLDNLKSRAAGNSIAYTKPDHCIINPSRVVQESSSRHA